MPGQPKHLVQELNVGTVVALKVFIVETGLTFFCPFGWFLRKSYNRTLIAVKYQATLLAVIMNFRTM